MLHMVWGFRIISHGVIEWTRHALTDNADLFLLNKEGESIWDRMRSAQEWLNAQRYSASLTDIAPSVGQKFFQEMEAHVSKTQLQEALGDQTSTPAAKKKM